MNFIDFFRQATGNPDPFPYQVAFAEADELPHLVHAPTGAGKTATAVLGWLWRFFHKKPAPRRLVYCLPMRVLVEQTQDNVRKWLDALGLKDCVGVHILMGGTELGDWHLHPEKPAILIGTQDMLLSRALNRGYAESRFHWPIDFGLLNSDCLWVFDEPQLMANGVSTSAQLAGLRHSLKPYGECRSVWMSATLERTWLDTVDFKDKFTAAPLELTDEDYKQKYGLLKKMTADKTLAQCEAAASKDGKAVAKEVLKLHLQQDGTQTLVIANTVDRAKAVYAELEKLRKKSESPKLLLVHSRFRPHERQRLNAQLQYKGEAAADRIIVATQVVEAGVDISSRTLITELAPWASIVQRIGRCNRTGDDTPGRVFWIDLDEKQSLPYDEDDLVFSREKLKKLDGQGVSPKQLADFKKDEGFELKFEHKHVLRRRDLLDLFDTSPDLSGNDIDISRFVRSDDPDTDVQVFWREGEPEKKATAVERRREQPFREELCNVPIASFKKEFIEAGKSAFRWDFIDEIWRGLGKKDANSVVPGQVFWIPSDQGGYDELLGWEPSSKGKVLPVPRPEPAAKPERNDLALDSDDWSHFGWRSIAGHTDEVVAELEKMLEVESGLPLDAKEHSILRAAARWHDWGKAHPVFQSAIKNEGRPESRNSRDIAKAPDGFWRRCTREVGSEVPLRVSRFRHELASTLGVLALLNGKDVPAEWRELSSTERDAAVYLIAAHHGKIRLSIRSMPEERPLPPEPGKTLFAAGVWSGDQLPAMSLGKNLPNPHSVELSLSPMLLGAGSWTDRALGLVKLFGPFRLAYLEALLRAADCRASLAAHDTKEAGHA